MKMIGHKKYQSQLIYDGCDYIVQIPDEIIQELGWNEDTEIKMEIKLGDTGNVLVISKA